MENVLFETLLNENEGNHLDFKEEQYPFADTNDYQKSEIIKDILAFANAWRHAEAYILIGVEEIKGARSIIKGVSNHLDDSNLQQLVNSKTLRPIDFHYEAFEYEGKQVGIIRVPLQERPFFIKNDFGKLKANIVYLRRGSSTEIATPDEIAKMGLVASEDLDKQKELRILIDELSDFLEKTGNNFDIYRARVKFEYQQYLRLFEKGVFTKTPDNLRRSIFDIFNRIKEADRLIQNAWDNRYSPNRPENLNEARDVVRLLPSEVYQLKIKIEDYLK